MANQFELHAELRSDVGKGASRRLRRQNKVPAILYGAGKDPVNLVLDHDAVWKALSCEAFYSHILDLYVGDNKEAVVLKDLQRHVYRPRIQHMDFLRVSATEKLTMMVPLHFKGEDVAPGVVEAGGVIAHLMSELEIRCLPADLPEYIEVDVSKLNLNESIYLAELKLPKGVEILSLAHDAEQDQPVVSIHVPKIEAPEKPVAEEAAEGKAEGEAAEAESKAEDAGDKAEDKH